MVQQEPNKNLKQKNMAVLGLLLLLVVILFSITIIRF